MSAAIAFENSYANLPEGFSTPIEPMPVSQPKLIALNKVLAESLNLDTEFLQSADGLQMLSGNKFPTSAAPLAMAYAGQQFGNWSPQLGDGRALLLGEVISKNGVRHDVQLKGSGPTPFSRGGDGRAWLGPVLREYLVSEAMAALNVPTTRALAAVSTGDSVYREEILPGAIVTRTSKSLIRVGTFQYFAIRQDTDSLKTLADYTIDRLYPKAREQSNPYVGLFQAVLEAQAHLVARWMAFGFIHGVMNTDNVSIAGETIDYGPCAFMDVFHPDQKFSSIDEGGRYAYSNQPGIAHWNMVQFAQAILPLIDSDQQTAVEMAQAAANEFQSIYTRHYQEAMNAKLGLTTVEEGDAALLNDLLKIMHAQHADYTLTFYHLSEGEAAFLEQFDDTSDVVQWLKRLRLRQTEGASKIMAQANPAIIPRNHRIEQAIREALDGDFQLFHRLNDALATPFEVSPENQDLALAPKPKEIVRHTFCGT